MNDVIPGSTRNLYKYILIYLPFFLVSLSFSNPVYAYLQYATESAVVSANVPIQSHSAPILISPANNSASNIVKTVFVWQRPATSTSNNIFYNLYVDDQAVAINLDNNLVSQDLYFYSVLRSGNTFTLTLKYNLADGYHTWYVSSRNEQGFSISSPTWTFYVKEKPPYIILTRVGNDYFSWDTRNSSAIPANQTISLPDVYATISGQVEPHANLSINITCPDVSCTSQGTSGNINNGNWTYHPNPLTRGITYKVHIQATDAGGNNVSLPDFWIIVPAPTTPTGIITPTPVSSITPKFVKPTMRPVITSAQPTQAILIVYPTTGKELLPTEILTPAPTIPPPELLSPTPPPPTEIITPKPAPKLPPVFPILLVLGLPLHLAMIIFGTGITLLQIPFFLLILLFPFITRKKYQTRQFTRLEFVDPKDVTNNTNTIANISGYYTTKTLPAQILAKLFLPGYQFKSTIIESSILGTSCLCPLIKNSVDTLERLQKYSMTYRLIPLIIGSLTGLVAFIISPSIFYFIYLYLCLHLLTSEYLYPKF